MSKSNESHVAVRLRQVGTTLFNLLASFEETSEWAPYDFADELNPCHDEVISARKELELIKKEVGLLEDGKKLELWW